MGILFNSSELGFDFFGFAQSCFTKKREEKTVDSYSLYVRSFGFYTQQNLNSAANFVFTSQTGLPHVVLFFDSKPGSCQPIYGIIIANKSFGSAKAVIVCSFAR